jgi:hypothetical protein
MSLAPEASLAARADDAVRELSVALTAGNADGHAGFARAS